MLTDKATADIQIDYSGLPTPKEDAGVGVPATEPGQIDYASMPSPRELTAGDILRESVRGVAVPSMVGPLRVGQAADLLKADQDVQDLIKLGVAYPQETLTGAATEEQLAEVRGKGFEELLREAYPTASESASVAQQFGFTMGGSVLEWGTRPSSWVFVAGMKAYNKPLFEEVMRGIAKRPRLHNFLTKEIGPSLTKTLEKSGRGEPLNSVEKNILRGYLDKAAKISKQEAMREKVQVNLMAKKAAKDPALLRKLQAERGYPQAKPKLLPAPEGTPTAKTPITDKPVVTFDSRTTKPIEVSNLVVDQATGKPLEIMPDTIVLVSETASGGIESVPVSGPTELIDSIKAITQKINDLAMFGMDIPQSLLKRQQALLQILKVPGKAGKAVSTNKLLGVAPPAKVTVSEKQLLKERFRTLARGFREGKKITQDQITENLTALKQMINDSELDATDKAKFIGKLTDVKKLSRDPEAFKDVVTSVQARIEDLELAREKKILGRQIGKELKRTKPLKQGGRKRKGRYNPEDNRFFDELRRIDKLTKEQALAELESMPKMDLTEADIIKTRLLSYKANGIESSVELRTQILEDLKRLKEMAAKAKTEADFEKALAREEAVEEVLEAIAKVSGDKGTFWADVANVYNLTASDTYSLLNRLLGAPLARKLDPMSAELDRNTAFYFRVKDMTKKATEIFNISDAELPKMMVDMEGEKFTLVDVKGTPLERSKLDLLDIYNSIKNPVLKARWYNAFGEEQITEVLNNLTEAEMRFADLLMESLNDYFPVFNAHAVELRGLDLGRIQPYWPASTDQIVDIFDELVRASQIPSAEKPRSASGKIMPDAVNAWLKTQKHIYEGEHVRHLSRKYENLKRIFTNRKVREAIKKKFGEDIYKNLMEKVERMALTHLSASLDYVSNVVGRAVNNWVGAKIAFPNATTPIKQLISVINFAEKMPVGEWAAGFGGGVTSAKETFDYMWKNSPWIEQRYNRGYSEAVAQAIRSAKKLGNSKDSWAKGLSVLARSGDITAIIYGGYPYVKWLQTPAGGGHTEAEAFEMFKYEANKAQQSPLSSALSDFQNSRHPAARIFLAFKNTSFQYFRKGGDAIISYVNGDISAGQLAKIINIYWIINPILFGAAGAAVKYGVEKISDAIRGTERAEAQDIMVSALTSLATSPFQVLPIIDDVTNYAARRMLGQKPGQVLSLPVLSDIERAVRTFDKKEPTFMDYLKTFGTAAEVGTGAPVHTILRMYGWMFGDEKGRGSKRPSLNL